MNYKSLPVVACLSSLWAFACIASFARTPLEQTQTDPFQIRSRKIVDLTHVLAAGLPDFRLAGDTYQYKKIFTVEKDGYGNGAFSTVEHYGTHVDAPSHFFNGKPSIDQISVQDLVVSCVVIDVRDEVERDPDYRLTEEKIHAFEKDGQIPEHCAVLLLTGWADRWAKPGQYRNADNKGTMHFPGFGGEACELLVNKRHVASLGIDTLSIDAGTCEDYLAHKIALGKGLYMMENLKDIDALPARGALLICGPLRIKDGTGSPARVVAIAP